MRANVWNSADLPGAPRTDVIDVMDIKIKRLMKLSAHAISRAPAWPTSGTYGALVGEDGAAVTVAGHGAHHERRRPDDFHRQLIRMVANYPTRRDPPWCARNTTTRVAGCITVGRRGVLYTEGNARNAR